MEILFVMIAIVLLVVVVAAVLAFGVPVPVGKTQESTLMIYESHGLVASEVVPVFTSDKKHRL